MTHNKQSKYKLLSKAALVALIATAPFQMAKADTLVAPVVYENVEGSSANFFPVGRADFSASPYQQIYDASLFGVSPILISSFAFRADGVIGTADIINLASLQVIMSTTSKLVDGLGATPTNNLGIDATMVINDLDGRQLSSDLSKDENGVTYDFDYIFAFDVPFLYDPSQGNLIFQIDTVHGVGDWFTYFDATDSPTDGTSRGYLPPPPFPFSTDTIGLVTQFTFEPVSEPSLLGLLGIGLVGAGFAYKRRKV